MSFITDKIWKIAIILVIFLNNYFKDNKIVKTLKSIDIYFMMLRPSDEKVDLDLTFSSEIEPFRFNKRTIQR